MIVSGSSDKGAINYLKALNNRNIFIIDDVRKISKIYKGKKPKLIITGSAFRKSIDKRLLRFAQKKKILSISVVEHWTNFKSRFKIGNKFYFPDFIFVNDKFAFNLAVKDGIPKKKLIILGNAYFENLAKKKIHKFRNRRTKNFDHLSPKTILFISEKIKGEKNLKREYSSDEFETIKKIIKFKDRKDKLIIKCHPEEKKKKFRVFKSKNIIIKKNLSFEEMIFLPDYIIGMKSILLLELSLFRNDIISFRPKKDLSFIGEKLKVVKLIRNVKKLFYPLIKNDNRFFKTYFDGSSKKINLFLKNKINEKK